MDKEKATERLSFRVTPQLKAKIEERAAEEGRTPSNFVINVLNEYIRKIYEAKNLLKK